MRPALDLNCFRQCWHLSASCNCRHGLTMRNPSRPGDNAPHPCLRGQGGRKVYLVTHFHVLFEPHEGLPGNHIAGGADSLPPFMDGSLPLLFRATCEAKAGQGLRLLGLPNALASRGIPHALATGSSPPRRPVLGPAKQPPPGAGWATGVGASLLTVTGVASTFFRTSSEPNPSCFLER